MKKLIAILLILVLSMSFFGCAMGTEIKTETKTYVKEAVEGETELHFYYTYRSDNFLKSIKKYEIVGDAVLLYESDGEIICTSINNVIIYETKVTSSY